MTTILVPLDGSHLAERAIPFAITVAQATGATLHLTRAIVEDGAAGSAWPLSLEPAPAPGQTDETTAQRDLAESADWVRERGVAVTTAVRPGRPASVILEDARAEQAASIVMSTHGRSGLGRWLYGSVADEVLRCASVPVLLISSLCEPPWEAKRQPRVLVALDGSDVAETILAPLQGVFRPLALELILLRVAGEIDHFTAHGDECRICRRTRLAGELPDIEPIRAQRYLDDVAARLRAAGLAATPLVALGSAAPTILRIAREQDVDLIAMATHGRSGLARLVLGSVATATLRQATVPLLLARPTPAHLSP